MTTNIPSLATQFQVHPELGFKNLLFIDWLKGDAVMKLSKSVVNLR